MAPAIRAAGVQIALPAARFGCLADDRMLRLLSVQLYRVSVASLRRQGHQLHPTSLAGRGCNHAMADNRGREGTALGRGILINPLDFTPDSNPSRAHRKHCGDPISFN